MGFGEHPVKKLCWASNLGKLKITPPYFWNARKPYILFMKKLIGLNKAKEADEKAPVVNKKATQKEEKIKTNATHEHENAQKRELFWDGYSDIGYC